MIEVIKTHIHRAELLIGEAETLSYRGDEEYFRAKKLAWQAEYQLLLAVKHFKKSRLTPAASEWIENNIREIEDMLGVFEATTSHIQLPILNLSRHPLNQSWEDFGVFDLLKEDRIKAHGLLDISFQPRPHELKARAIELVEIAKKYPANLVLIDAAGYFSRYIEDELARAEKIACYPFMHEEDLTGLIYGEFAYRS